MAKVFQCFNQSDDNLSLGLETNYSLIRDIKYSTRGEERYIK